MSADPGDHRPVDPRTAAVLAAAETPGAAADLTPRSTSAARISLSRIMSLLDSNLLGTIHGGVVMKMVDDTAGAVAQRHAGRPAVTAAMDGMTFLEPVQIGDLVQAHAQVNWAGRTSMEVGVKVTAERWNEVGQTPRRVATAYLVFVAVDTDGRPQPIPPVAPETDEDRRRFREAQIRRQSRLTRRDAILSSREPGPAAAP